MAYLLFIDTSGETGTVAVSNDDELLAVKTNSDNRNHASFINIMIDAALDEANITVKQLSAIVVCGGPGSYTGLRIGLSTAKSFCYILDIQLMMHNKLTLLNWQEYKINNTYDRYVSLLKARENEYYVTLADKAFHTVIEPKHMHLEEVADMVNGSSGSLLITGDETSEIKDLFKVNNIRYNSTNSIDISSWVMYAYEQYKCHDFVNLAIAEPFYLKQVFTHKSKNIS